MKTSEIFEALAMLEKEKGIPQQYMLDKIVQALSNAYKQDHPDVENVAVETDPAKHDIKMFIEKNVVDDITNPSAEMSLDQAREISGKYSVGDVVRIPVDNVDFGRIAAGHGKQIIIQGLKEAERDMVYNQFSSKEHEMLTGIVTRIDPRSGSISLRVGSGTESTEALMLAGEQISGEKLVEGQRVKVYMMEVRRGTRGVQVMVSRTHPGLVKRLFELEVPEMFDGIVEIKNISREAGSRSKMAVLSNDANIDPIGACVGPKGQRVAAVVNELNGEKIEIVRYSDNPEKYIASALAPAEVTDVWMSDDGKGCRVIVPDSLLSLAIGKEGQNARLAARLTGYKIDIKPESYHDEEPEEPAGEAPAEDNEDN